MMFLVLLQRELRQSSISLQHRGKLATSSSDSILYSMSKFFSAHQFRRLCQPSQTCTKHAEM